MYTSLALEREMHKRGMKADFRATGQTGIFIADSGVAIDAIVSDFISGAVEWLTPANDADHWDLIEGQGSIVHPSYAGVTLGLIHGAAPHALVHCHDPTRKHVRGLPDYPLVGLEEVMEACLWGGQADQPGGPLCRHLGQHGGALRGRGEPHHARARGRASAARGRSPARRGRPHRRPTLINHASPGGPA